MRGSGLLLWAAGIGMVAWSAAAGQTPKIQEQIEKALQKIKEAEKKALDRPRAESKAAPAEPLPVQKAKAPSEEPGEADAQTLRKAGIATDGPALLKFFRARTLLDSQRAEIVQSIRQLGSESYRQREEAAAMLVAAGPKGVELLRSAQHGSDLEVVRRVERCLQRIQEADPSLEVQAAAVRLLALRKPASTVEVMLAYVPFTDNDFLLDEIRLLLTSLAGSGGEPLLVVALSDRQPPRRAIAAEVLSRTAFASHKDALHKLLSDHEALVRFRVAQGLAYARQRDAVPALINVLPELPLDLAWQAEDFLFRMVETAALTPPSAAVGNDPATRLKSRDAWLAWWKAEGAHVDLAKLQETPKMMGRTLVVLLDQGRIMELGADNEPRWQIDGLVFPLDVQMLGDKSVLIAEYHANRVTERDLRGNILWQKAVAGPLLAQRLPNGHTFIASDTQFLEYDKDEREVVSLSVPDETKKIMKAMKLPNGEVACLTSDARVVRYDVSGKELKELHSFTVQIATRLFGGRIHMLPNGRVLVPHNAEDKVIEYDGRGKAVWEVAADKPVAAVRLPNGHTLITSMNAASGAIEVDRAGREVWSYRATTRVTRALKR
jgi:hypothetical protein